MDSQTGMDRHGLRRLDDEGACNLAQVGIDTARGV